MYPIWTQLSSRRAFPSATPSPFPRSRTFKFRCWAGCCGSGDITPSRRGQFDRRALIQTIELLKSGQLVLMAPEGTRHSGGIQPAKDGLAYVACLQSRRPSLCRRRSAALRIGGDVSSACAAPTPRSFLAAPFRFRTEGQRRIPRDQLSRMISEAMYRLALTIPDEYRHLRGAITAISRMPAAIISNSSDAPTA